MIARKFPIGYLVLVESTVYPPPGVARPGRLWTWHALDSLIPGRDSGRMSEESSAHSQLIEQISGDGTISAVSRRIRRLLVIVFLAAVAYGILTTASRGFCADDAKGIDPATGCVQLTLSPSPIIFAGLLAVVIIALSRAAAPGIDLHAALPIFDRAAVIGALTAALAAVVAQIWFWSVPITEFHSGGFSYISPFLIGIINLELTPLP